MRTTRTSTNLRASAHSSVRVVNISKKSGRAGPLHRGSAAGPTTIPDPARRSMPVRRGDLHSAVLRAQTIPRDCLPRTDGQAPSGQDRRSHRGERAARDALSARALVPHRTVPLRSSHPVNSC